MNRLLILILVLPQFLFAENVQLISQINFVPEKVIGLVFNQHGTSYFHDTKLTTNGLNQTIISFEAPTELPEDTYASALLIKENGQVSFASVISLGKTNVDYSKLPICEYQVPKEYADQEAVIKQLVDVRKERVDLLKRELSKSLTEAIVQKIRVLEKEKGFVNKTTFSSQLSPTELNIRLFKLVQSLEN